MREYLQLVSRTAFSNPFSEEHAALNRRLSEESEALPPREMSTRVLARVRQHLASLFSKRPFDLRTYAGLDRELLKNAFLFEIHYHQVDNFDRLIDEQVNAGDTPCKVPFAREVLAEMEDRGIEGEEAERYLAFFYQFRRAFYFIDRGLVGKSRSMTRLRCHLWNNVFTFDIRWYDRYLWNRMEDCATLLLGRTGTGKGAAASAIGRSGFIPFDARSERFSESFTRNFIEINLSQYPESLIESELFGHKKGAFTGAIENHEGVFSRCSPHGAIFLDEVGELSIPVQVKLLQVLQERRFSPVGSGEPCHFHGRVIAATNRSLKKLRKEGAFRDDFFYRLCSDVIEVPSLQQRLQEESAELGILINHLLRRILGEESPEMAKVIEETLKEDLGPDYPWPGNVRELEQAVRRILLTNHYKGDTFLAPPEDLPGRLLDGIERENLDARQLLAGYCALLYQ
ncbi:MAG: sigma-54-dependent Fis family transcriptional regulator, partial [Desulfuromonadales bacterium]|nr:sigma-54-dependent Fis family transcriptional regulator [Desulfuromonadales bacterium]NIR33530.1 sigma-54-dependent Fis family transcriptional regulator [Desulfuromonadales bacterium]NIS39704.1 sigma-54-dependent Fis family transcriptional regulator [Desulfuromonadales bacterium]